MAPLHVATITVRTELPKYLASRVSTLPHVATLAVQRELPKYLASPYLCTKNETMAPGHTHSSNRATQDSRTCGWAYDAPAAAPSSKGASTCCFQSPCTQSASLQLPSSQPERVWYLFLHWLCKQACLELISKASSWSSWGLAKIRHIKEISWVCCFTCGGFRGDLIIVEVLFIYYTVVVGERIHSVLVYYGHSGGISHKGAIKDTLCIMDTCSSPILIQWNLS